MLVNINTQGHTFSESNYRYLNFINEIKKSINKDGYAHSGIKSNKMDFLKSLLSSIDSKNIQDYKDSWNFLEQDQYMLDQGKYRYRKHTVFSASSLDLYPIIPQKNKPHFQHINYNELNGGIERWYKPIDKEVLINPCFYYQLLYPLKIFNALEKNNIEENFFEWYIEAHQFRIYAKNEEGKPTPEGIHRDGVSYVYISMVQKKNIYGGVSRIFDNKKDIIKKVEMEKTFESLYLDDKMLYHDVSPIRPKNNQEDAFRDVLVVTFKRI